MCTRSATTWSQQADLKAFNAEANDQFGKSVAIAGDSMVVGANFDYSATGINGNQSNNAAENAGAAYVFTVDGVNARSLDIDGNGEQDALSDGILVIRYLLGLSGNALTADAVANNCKRCSHAEIESYLGNLSIYDVDATGSSNAFSVGLLILRYLCGLTGNALTDKAVESDCSRCSSNDIEDYLGEL
ncbi:MAG: FG-GAP repeat protein [Methylococcales bacterium]